MSNYSHFDMEAWRVQESADRLERIRIFSTINGLETRTYTEGGRIILLLDDAHGRPIEPDFAARLLERQQLMAEEGIVNNCYHIAARAVHDGIASGAAHSRDGVSDFVGYANHSLNVHRLGDGRFISFDLTAAHDIDHQMGNFDVLAIGADTEEGLLQRLSGLYGGTWEVIPREETEMSYYLEYGSQDERMKALEDMNALYAAKRAARETAASEN